MSETLFEVSQVESAAGEAAAPRRGAARVLRPNRLQVLMRPCDLESLLPPDHRARVIWEFVSKLDLSQFYDAIHAREGEGGRAAFDPAVERLAASPLGTPDGAASAPSLERRSI